MKIIGVTGGIGSGKSTLCNLLVEHAQAELYSADIKAKELMNRDKRIREALIESFGSGCYADGQLDRGYLSGIVFGDSEKLSQLNNIVHPIVKEDFKRWSEECKSDIALLESAILFESGFDSLVDIKVAVLAPKQLRIERVCQREGCNEEAVLRRIEAQYSDDELQKRADLCVVNIYEEDLESSVQEIVKAAQRWQ